MTIVLHEGATVIDPQCRRNTRFRRVREPLRDEADPTS
jgi:hypothetical protein